MNEIYERINADFKNGHRKINAVLKDGTKKRLRLGKTAYGELIYMKPKSRKRGYYLNELDIVSYTLPKKLNIKLKWEHSIDRAIAMLEESGLWEDLLARLKIARAVGYEKIQEAYTIYWRKGEGVTYSEQDKINARDIGEIDKRLLTEDGTANTDILWYMHRPLKIMKMVFDEYNNDAKLKAIQEAMRNKEEYHERGDYQYDNSFEYSPKQNKAWYSREFRGCGNGHYYLALNGTHAMFYEDD